MFFATNLTVWKVNHEEADTRIFLHALQAVEQQNKPVLIKACNTDILAVAVSVFVTL